MQNEVWLELKFGSRASPVTLARLEDRRIARAAMNECLKRAERRAKLSEALDPVLGVMDNAELRKLRNLQQVLFPNLGRDNETKDA